MRRIVFGGVMLSLGLALAPRATIAQSGRLPDIVMLERKCKSIVSGLGKEESPMSREHTPKVRFCWRKGDRVECEQQNPNEKPLKVNFVVAEEESPKMLLAGDNSLLVVTIDWSIGEFILAQIFHDKAAGMVVQIQCSGMVATGADMARAKTRSETSRR